MALFMVSIAEEEEDNELGLSLKGGVSLFVEADDMNEAILAALESFKLSAVSEDASAFNVRVSLAEEMLPDET